MSPLNSRSLFHGWSGGRRFTTVTTYAFSSDAGSTPPVEDEENLNNKSSAVVPPVGDSARFFCCFTRYDLEGILDETDTGEDIAELTFTASTSNLDEILKKAQERFGKFPELNIEDETSRQQDVLEYYTADGGWKPMISMQALKDHQQKLKMVQESNGDATADALPPIIPVRYPNFFDKLEDDDNRDYPDQDQANKEAPPPFEDTINFLVAHLKSFGYVRDSPGSMRRVSRPDNQQPPAATESVGEEIDSTREQGGEEKISTRDWILTQAQTDLDLRQILIDFPHALEHIAECIHYDFVWNLENTFSDDFDPDNLKNFEEENDSETDFDENDQNNHTTSSTDDANSKDKTETTTASPVHETESEKKSA